MAIQVHAGQRVPISRDDFLSMLQNGELYDLSYEQVMEAVKCHLDDILAQIRQDNMRRSERLRQVSHLVDFANAIAAQNQTLIKRQAANIRDIGYRGNATSIVTRGTRGFGDMWSKSLSFMDLMYVKLSTAISILAVLLEQAARNKKVEQQRSDVRHEPVNGVCYNPSELGYYLDSLNQMMSYMKGKITKSDGKQDPTNLEVWHLCNKAQVNGVCDNLSQLGYNLDSLNQMVSRMKGQIMTSDEKQDPTNFGVWHLCNKDGQQICGKAQD